MGHLGDILYNLVIGGVTFGFSPPGHSFARPQRILVVDDDPAVLRLVRDKLDRAGFEVLTATSGQHALDLIARRGLPHLAIVDTHRRHFQVPNEAAVDIQLDVQLEPIV